MENIAGDDIDRLLEDGLNKSKRHRDRSRSHDRRDRRRSRSRSRHRQSKRHRDVLDRDECTIFAGNIHPGVDERDIFEFFSQCGTVSDILLMRDSRSGTSKGFGYVEFADKESVVAALTTNGQYLGDFPIMVSVSNAEKSRIGMSTTSSLSVEGPFKLYFANIDESITADDLEPIFSAFGVVEGIYVDKKADRNTHTKSGFVEYRYHHESTFAMTNLNGMSLLNRKMRISQTDLQGGANAIGGNIPGMNASLLDEGQGGLQMSANSRVMLMQRLQASASKAEKTKGEEEAQRAEIAPKRTQSRCVLLKNMFDPDEESEEGWELDIKEDVSTECRKFGALESCVVDKNSLGHVYLIFRDLSGAIEATNQLNGRWFSQKQIAAAMIEPEVYQRMCPKFA